MTSKNSLESAIQNFMAKHDLTIRRFLAYSLVIPSALTSMQNNFIEQGFTEEDAWKKVVSECYDWYFKSLFIFCGVIFACVLLNSTGIFGALGTLFFTGISVGAVMAALRLLKWHKGEDV